MRRAFALAIDRRSIVRKVTYGLYDADNGPRGLFTWAYDPHANNIPYNPQGAMELLGKDHWDPNADGIREKNEAVGDSACVLHGLGCRNEICHGDSGSRARCRH